jgi:DNA adenine methylase
VATGELRPKPFLKWAGGKQAVAQQILSRFPESICSYFEPFVGAGSLLFSLPKSLRKTAMDANAELILTYQAVQSDVDAVVAELRKRSNTKEDYLNVRAWDRAEDFASLPRSVRASRFIFLNKCGFNGLYRVNSRGFYNIPYGTPSRVEIVSEENLRRVSHFLNEKDGAGSNLVNFRSGDFEQILDSGMGPGTFVYLDPPYDPVSETSGFVDYTASGFGASEQERLRDFVERLTRIGVKILMSNTATERIMGLYDSDDFGYSNLEVRRSIAASASSRGMVSEVLIDNYARAEKYVKWA